MVQFLYFLQFISGVDFKGLKAYSFYALVNETRLICEEFNQAVKFLHHCLRNMRKDYITQGAIHASAGWERLRRMPYVRTTIVSNVRILVGQATGFHLL